MGFIDLVLNQDVNLVIKVYLTAVEFNPNGSQIGQNIIMSSTSF